MEGNVTGKRKSGEKVTENGGKRKRRRKGERTWRGA